MHIEDAIAVTSVDRRNIDTVVTSGSIYFPCKTNRPTATENEGGIFSVGWVDIQMHAHDRVTSVCSHKGGIEISRLVDLYAAEVIPLIITDSSRR